MICCVLLTFSTVNAIDLDGNPIDNHLEDTLNQSVFISQSESSNLNENTNNLRVYSEDNDCVESMNELYYLEGSKDKSLKSDSNSINSDEYSLKSSLSSINSSDVSKNYDVLDDEKKIEKCNLEDVYINNDLASVDVSPDGDLASKKASSNMESKNKNSLSSNALGASTSTFSDLQTLINNAQAGSTINLEGKTFIGNGSFISIKKAITINGGSSSNLASFDARDLSYIFKINASNVHILNCKFTHSLSKAIFFWGNDSSVVNCLFDDNYQHLRGSADTKNLLVSKCNFTNGHSEAGSTINIFSENATVINCNFINNLVKGDEQGHGAALQIGASPNTTSEGYVINCSFINNTVISDSEDTHAGALCFRPGIKVYNSVFINNYCNKVGGATTLHSDGEILNCTFINNSAGEYGGAISTGFETDDISVNITNCTFINNYAPMGGAIQIKGNNVKVTNSTFKENKARESDGGAVYIVGNEALIINSSFEDNYAKNVGAGLLINGSKVSVLNSSFNRNNASYGAGVYVVGSDANLFISNFTNHNVKNGSVYIKGIKTYVYDCNFINNTGENGAGLYIQGSNATLILSNFTNNNVTKDGGAVFVVGSNANLIASNFLYNNAIPNASDKKSGLGGAVYIKGNNNTIDSSTFKYNTARNGSAIYTDGKKMNLSNTNFDKNQAWSYVLDSLIKPSSSYFNRSDILINLTLIGGNNIANAIYNTASVNDIYFYNVSYISSKGKKVTSSNEIHPVNGAENSKNGTLLYQDDREDNQLVNVIVYRDSNGRSSSSNGISPNSILLNRTFTTGIYGNISLNLSSYANRAIAPGNYLLYAEHYEDDYYKEIDEDNQFEVLPLVDVAVDITSAKAIVEYNKTNKFTIKVNNYGPNNATDVKVNAMIPKGLILVSSSPSLGTYNASSGIWTIGNLNAGSNQTLVINVRTNTSGMVDYPVNVTSYEKDTNESNNRNNQSIKIPECDLLVDVNASSHSAKFNEGVNWTILVKNNGPDNASKVIVSISNLASGDLIYLNSNNSNFNISSQKLELSKLASGEELRFVISTKTNVSNKKISLNASASTDTFEYNLNNNFDDDYLNVLPLCDIGIGVKVSNKTANRNDVVKWTLTVKNDGPDKASNVNVAISDLKSLGLIFVNSSDSNYNVNSNEWFIGDLDKGKSRELVIFTRVNATNKTILLKAIANTSTYETNKANNMANDTLSVSPLCDVAIDVTASENNANKNDIVNWTITVSNDGPNDAGNVKVSLTDLASLGLIIQNKSLAYNDVAHLENSTFNYNKTTNLWSIGNMRKGDEATLTVQTKVNCSNKDLIVKGIVNTTSFELNKTNNVDQDLLSVDELCDLAINVTVYNKTANYDDEVNWTIKVKNNGPDSASDVFLSISDLESLGLLYLNSSNDAFDSESYTWEIGDLGNGKSVTLILSTQVDISNDTIVLEGTVDTSTYEINKNNNLDDDSLLVNPLCDLIIDVEASSDTANNGDIVNWTITVMNDGPDDADDVLVNLTNMGSLNLEILNFSDDGFNPSTYEWIINDLDNNENATLVISTRVNCSDETLIISGLVNTSTYELDKENNYDDDVLEVNPLCDLILDIKVSDSPVNKDDIVDWTITVKNDGPDKADNILVTLDDLESLNLEILNFSDDGFDPVSFEWIINDLDNGENASLVISTRVNTSNETVDVKSSVISDTFELNYDNNHDNDSLKVNPLCDLILDINVSDSPVNKDEIVEWTITVKNDGPDKAENVIVNLTDLDSLDLIILNVSDDSFNPNTFEWIIGDLDIDEIISLIISTKVNASNETILVESHVGSDTFELNKENNFDDDSLEINPLCDLILDIKVSNSTANNGDIIDWTVTVKNDGPDKAENIVANLSHLESLDLIILDVSSDKFNPDSYEWIIGDLDKNGNVTLVISTRVNTSNETVDVKSSVISDTFELNYDNNHDNDSLKVNPLCDLILDINVSDSPINKDDIVEWTITVKNDGPDNAENVIVNLTDLESLDLMILNLSDDSFDKDSNIWFIGDLSKDESVDLIITTKANGSNETIVVDAIVDSDTFELNRDNNHDKDSLEINPLCDLIVDLDLSNSTINKDDVVDLTITVKNDGPDTASNVVLDLTDLEDLGLIVLNVSDDGYDDGSDKWFIGDLAPGETVDLVVRSQANVSNVSLPIEAIVSSDTFELNGDNNQDNETLSINPLCDLVIEITVSNGTANKGDIVEWTVIVYNNGPDDASDVVVSLDDLRALGLILLNVTYGSIQYNLSYDGSRIIEKTSFDGSGLVDKDSFDGSGLVDKDSYDGSGLVDNEDNEEKDNSASNLLSASSKLSGVGSDVDSPNLIGNSNVLKSSSLNDENPSEVSSVSGTSDASLSNGQNSENGLSDDSAYGQGSKNGLSDDSSKVQSANSNQASQNTFNNETNKWYIGDLAKDKGIVLKLSTEVNKSNDNITVPANVDTSTYEIVKSNNYDDDQLEVLPICDLEITIVPDKDTIYRDDVVNWIVTLTNHGPDNATDVSGFIDIPDGLEFLAYDLDKGTLDNISDGSSLRLKWDVGDLALNETVILYLSTKDLEDGVYLTNASANSSTLDSNESNNYDDALVEAIPLDDDSKENNTIDKSNDVVDKSDKKDKDNHVPAKKQNDSPRNKTGNSLANHQGSLPMKKTGNSLAVLVLVIFALFSLNYRKLRF